MFSSKMLPAYARHGRHIPSSPTLSSPLPPFSLSNSKRRTTSTPSSLLSSYSSKPSCLTSPKSSTAVSGQSDNRSCSWRARCPSYEAISGPPIQERSPSSRTSSPMRFRFASTPMSRSTLPPPLPQLPPPPLPPLPSTPSARLPPLLPPTPAQHFLPHPPRSA